MHQTSEHGVPRCSKESDMMHLPVDMKWKRRLDAQMQTGAEFDGVVWDEAVLDLIVDQSAKDIGLTACHFRGRETLQQRSCRRKAPI